MYTRPKCVNLLNIHEKQFGFLILVFSKFKNIHRTFSNYIPKQRTYMYQPRSYRILHMLKYNV